VVVDLVWLFRGGARGSSGGSVSAGTLNFGVGFNEPMWWIWWCGVVMRWCCDGEVWRC
jgi:hypothetical protein